MTGSVAIPGTGYSGSIFTLSYRGKLTVVPDRTGCQYTLHSAAASPRGRFTQMRRTFRPERAVSPPDTCLHQHRPRSDAYIALALLNAPTHLQPPASRTPAQLDPQQTDIAELLASASGRASTPSGCACSWKTCSAKPSPSGDHRPASSSECSRATLINIDPGFCSEQAVQIGVLAEDSFHAVVTQMQQTRETVRLKEEPLYGLLSTSCPVRASSSASTEGTLAAPIRWNISTACRSRGSACAA